jgi:hypothetical protein
MNWRRLSLYLRHPDRRRSHNLREAKAQHCAILETITMVRPFNQGGPFFLDIVVRDVAQKNRAVPIRAGLASAWPDHGVDYENLQAF